MLGICFMSTHALIDLLWIGKLPLINYFLSSKSKPSPFHSSRFHSLGLVLSDLNIFKPVLVSRVNRSLTRAPVHNRLSFPLSFPVAYIYPPTGNNGSDMGS